MVSSVWNKYTIFVPNKTLINGTSSIQQIRNLCDKALWINEGKVVAFDEVNKVCDAYLKAAENASKDQLKNIKLE